MLGVLVFIMLALIVLGVEYNRIKADTAYQILGSIFGVMIGSAYAGYFTLSSVSKQLSYNNQVAHEAQKEKNLKNIIIIENRFGVIRREYERLKYVIPFLPDQEDYNSLEDAYDSVKISMYDINNEYKHLVEINPEFISMNYLKKIYNNYSKHSEIQKHLESYVAEIDDGIDHLDLAINICSEIIEDLN